FPLPRARAQLSPSGTRRSLVQFTKYLGSRHLPLFEAREQFPDCGTTRTIGLTGLLGVGLGRWLHFDKRNQRANSIQTVLGGGVAAPEDLLHLLDGAVAANERGHDPLVFGREASKGWNLDPPLDSDVLTGKPYPLDFNWRPTRQSRERLPLPRSH